MHFHDTKLRQTSSAFISGNKPRHIGYSRLVGNPYLGIISGLPVNQDRQVFGARTWLYIDHGRRYFSIYESYKLGVHEQSDGLRADLWLHVSAIRFGSSEFNRRAGQLARGQAANGCRSCRSSFICFRRTPARWTEGIKAESWYWGFAAALIAYAITLKFKLFFAILVASLVLFWVSSVVLQKKSPY